MSIPRSLFLIVIAMSCGSPSRPASVSANPTVTQLRDAFLDRARVAGVVLPFVPEMREWTRPSMMSWRQEARAVAVPRWNELASAQLDLLTRMAGDEAATHRLFDLLFRWFLVPHELTHALQDNARATPPTHAIGERLANDVAVAFFHDRADARDSLDMLAHMLERARDRLPPLSEFGDEAALDQYFNEHYDELGRDLPRYGAFQVHFILDSIQRADSLRFDEVIHRAVTVEAR